MAGTAAETETRSRDGAVERACDEIRALIMQRRLVPGEHVRQDEIASLIGISRAPIRQALQVLREEHVVEYERNRGYFVKRYTPDQMKQLYVLRDLLETAVLDSLPPATEEALERLAAINEKIREPDLSVEAVGALNDEFHAELMRLSPMEVLVAEALRIWRMTVAFRILSTSVLADWSAIADDHDRMLDAFRRHDLDELAQIAREHRDLSLGRLLPILR